MEPEVNEGHAHRQSPVWRALIAKPSTSGRPGTWPRAPRSCSTRTIRPVPARPSSERFISSPQGANMPPIAGTGGRPIFPAAGLHAGCTDCSGGICGVRSRAKRAIPTTGRNLKLTYIGCLADGNYMAQRHDSAHRSRRRGRWSCNNRDAAVSAAMPRWLAVSMASTGAVLAAPLRLSVTEPLNCPRLVTPTPGKWERTFSIATGQYNIPLDSTRQRLKPDRRRNAFKRDCGSNDFELPRSLLATAGQSTWPDIITGLLTRTTTPTGQSTRCRLTLRLSTALK